MRTFLLAGGALLCFASNSLLCRRALEAGSLDPATFTSLRLAAGAAILAVLSWKSRRPAGSFWIPGLALFAYASAFSFAYVAIPTSTGALLLFSPRFR